MVLFYAGKYKRLLKILGELDCLYKYIGFELMDEEIQDILMRQPHAMVDFVTVYGKDDETAHRLWEEILRVNVIFL